MVEWWWDRKKWVFSVSANISLLAETVTGVDLSQIEGVISEYFPLGCYYIE